MLTRRFLRAAKITASRGNHTVIQFTTPGRPNNPNSEPAESMMELRIASRVDHNAWNETVRSCYGNVFHTAEWAEFVQADQPGARPSFFSLLEAGTVIGVALGFRTAS